jgi:predicted nucleic acid-binding protein
VTGLTLDAGALIAVERDDRSFAALLARTREHGGRITIPASALAQAMRSPVRQVRLVRLCRHQTTDLIPLDGPDATACGMLLAATRTTDIVDAHVVVCARRAGHTVVTSDSDDIKRLAPELMMFRI